MAAGLQEFGAAWTETEGSKREVTDDRKFPQPAGVETRRRPGARGSTRAARRAARGARAGCPGLGGAGRGLLLRSFERRWRALLQTSWLSRAAPPTRASASWATSSSPRLPSPRAPAGSVMAARSPSVVVSTLAREARGGGRRPPSRGARSAGLGSAGRGRGGGRPHLPGFGRLSRRGVGVTERRGRDGRLRRAPGRVACGRKLEMAFLVDMCRWRVCYGEGPWASSGMIRRGEGGGLS